MKLKLMKMGLVRMAVLPWDEDQMLVVPISDSSGRKDRWEMKAGKLIFQVWSSRTLWKKTLKDGRYYSVRPDKIRRELLQWIANNWLGGASPEGPQGAEEYFQEEMRKWAFVEAEEPLFND